MFVVLKNIQVEEVGCEWVIRHIFILMWNSFVNSALILLDIPQIYSEDAEKLELFLFLSKIYKIYFCTQKWATFQGWLLGGFVCLFVLSKETVCSKCMFMLYPKEVSTYVTKG